MFTICPGSGSVLAVPRKQQPRRRAPIMMLILMIVMKMKTRNLLKAAPDAKKADVMDSDDNDLSLFTMIS